MASRLTIVLLGHTGEGKSATGNTILGQKAFESKRSFKPVTRRISEAAGSVFGLQVSVVDTPGILCPGSEEDIRSYCQTVSRPRLFLVVVKLDRFTEERQRAVVAACRVVGEQRHHQAYLLFTNGDALDVSLDDFINEDDESPLPNLVGQFQGRCVVFNNRNGGPQQVRELLEASGHLEEAPGRRVQRKVVLLGMCGAGKSASGNTLLGREMFRSVPGFDSVTAACESHSAVVEGRRLTVLDTPGLNDRNVRAPVIANDILSALKVTGPEIHAFVIVVKIDRVSKAECQLLHSLPQLFGKEAARYTMVLFTYGDLLDGQSIDHTISASRFTSELVGMCGGRYCVFSNSQRRDRRQVQGFLLKVDEILNANMGNPCRFVSLSLGMEVKLLLIKLIEWLRSFFDSGSPPDSPGPPPPGGSYTRFLA